MSEFKVSNETVRRQVEATGSHPVIPPQIIWGKDGWAAVKIEEAPGFVLVHFPVEPIDFFSVKVE